ncbi:unnamed protein product [Toxocara canis]|uniref:LIN9_C domain-containing protein n=1 Tax=Toxocara canis TaxID=6265 RepID=A0A183VB15_TOXCA|nr:unnamed protein product [Toxocara canis]
MAFPGLPINMSLTFGKVRSLGQQRCTALDLSTLSESIADIRKQIFPSNAAAFQDYVEVHMKHVHNMMLNSGAF